MRRDQQEYERNELRRLDSEVRWDNGQREEALRGPDTDTTGYFGREAERRLAELQGRVEVRREESPDPVLDAAVVRAMRGNEIYEEWVYRQGLW